MLKVDEARANQAKEYFIKTLSFMDYLEEFKLLDKSVKTSQGIDICCPFHHEKAPSLKIDFESNRYNCFGCGEKGGGNIISFITRYKKECLGQTYVNYYKVIDLLIKSSPKHALILGFDTIFINSFSSIENRLNVKPKRFTFSKEEPKNFATLSKRLCDDGDVDAKVTAISLMQEGFPVELIYDTLYPSNNNQTKSTSMFSNVTLDDLLRED